MTNKRGSYMVEAAIVLPFIIFSVIACVLIVMDFYESVADQCEDHRLSRASVGIETDAESGGADAETDEGSAGGPGTQSNASAQSTPIGGVSYIRKYQLARRLTNTDNENHK